MISVSIITIGDELLIGQVIDTNSAWIAQQLNLAGIAVKRRVAVGDEWQAIWQALDEESRQSKLVLITGGLGPTADDITKPLLCHYFGGKMIIDKGVLAHVTYLFEQVLKRPMIERNRKQAEVPDVCTVLHNSRGTAPGMMFEKNGVIYISMPGVPHEMKGIITDHVLPMIKSRFPLSAIAHRTMLTAGLGESFLAEKIQQFETALPPHIKLAYLPHFGMVRLRLTTTGEVQATIEKELDEQFAQLKMAVGDCLVTDCDEPMETVVAHLLQASGKTMGTVESCTGGYIAQQITQHPGSSKYYKGSIISYANALKTSLLGVNSVVLDTEGAVSEATVIAMAKGGLHQLQTDYIIAVSGIMGPDGGTTDKPVGTVWVAVGNRLKIETEKIQLRYNRRRNIDTTALNALNMLRKFIIQDT